MICSSLACGPSDSLKILLTITEVKSCKLSEINPGRNPVVTFHSTLFVLKDCPCFLIAHNDKTVCLWDIRNGTCWKQCYIEFFPSRLHELRDEGKKASPSTKGFPFIDFHRKYATLSKNIMRQGQGCGAWSSCRNITFYCPFRLSVGPGCYVYFSSYRRTALSVDERRGLQIANSD